MADERGVLLQIFHWYTLADRSLWKYLQSQSEQLHAAGFTAIWLPPAYKGAAGSYDTGYGVYDLYDLGEFDQKGTIPTKYGTKDEYVAAIASAHEHQLTIYADIVLNHRMGADETEVVSATPFPRNNRNEPRGPSVEIEAYTKFTFPGRDTHYSTFHWSWKHFDAVDHNTRNPEDSDTIFVFEGKQFDHDVSNEYGNYDYLMGCDLDFDSDEVRQELIAWGEWYADFTHIDGFRLDAVKHIPSWFFPLWLSEIQKHIGRNLFTVAEFWSPALSDLQSYIHESKGEISLFDVPLHMNFHRASIERRTFPLSEIFAGTLVEADPLHAVTFVANHDSQALQALESVVEPWFKPLAYALILLRKTGYPCVFIADYEGATYTDTGADGNKYTIEMPSFKDLIHSMLELRKTSLGGRQHDYFDHPNTIGWTFEGEANYPQPIAVIMSNGDGGTKHMATGKPLTGFIDITHNALQIVKTDDTGIGEFHCNGESLSIFVPGTK